MFFLTSGDVYPFPPVYPLTLFFKATCLWWRTRPVWTNSPNVATRGSWDSCEPPWCHTSRARWSQPESKSESQSLWFRPTWLQNSTTICMLIKEVLLDADCQGRIWMSLGYCGIQVFRFRKSTEICMNLSLLGALDRHFFTLLHAFQSLASTRIFPFVALHFHESKLMLLLNNSRWFKTTASLLSPKAWFGGPCQQLHSAHPASQTIKCTPPESKE